MRALRPILALAVVAWAVPAPAVAQVLYTISDLGVWNNGGTFIVEVGSSFNASGQVAVYNAFGSPSNLHAVRAGAGVAVNSPAADLGTLGGTTSYGFGINASGQVVGSSQLTGNTATHAFRTTATGRVSDPGTDLGVLPGGTNSAALAINASGQVTGNGDIGGGLSRAYRTTATGGLATATNLGTLGGTYSSGIAINASGQVAGDSELASGGVHAFRTTATGVITAASDLGSFGTLPGDEFSVASAMNDLGQVTGFANGGDGAYQHAFRTSPTGLISDPGADLGSLAGPLGFSAGYAINSFGVVVGETETLTGGAAFVYTTAMFDLNALIAPGSGWYLWWASGINDSGQIYGYGELNGVDHYYLLTPIPEPSSLALAGAVAVGGWVVRRRLRSMRSLEIRH